MIVFLVYLVAIASAGPLRTVSATGAASVRVIPSLEASGLAVHRSQQPPALVTALEVALRADAVPERELGALFDAAEIGADSAAGPDVELPEVALSEQPSALSPGRKPDQGPGRRPVQETPRIGGDQKPPKKGILSRLFSLVDEVLVSLFNKDHKTSMKLPYYYTDRTFEETRELYGPENLALEKLKGKNILDAACGGGSFVRTLRKGGVRAYGIDIKRTLRSIMHPYIFRQDLRRTNFSDSSFDAIFSTWGLFTYESNILNQAGLENIISGLREFERVVRPGGSIYLGPLSPNLPIEFLKQIVLQAKLELVAVKTLNDYKDSYSVVLRRPVSPPTPR